MKMPHLSMDSFFSGKKSECRKQQKPPLFSHVQIYRGLGLSSHQIHQRRPGTALGERAESAWEAQGMWLAAELECGMLVWKNAWANSGEKLKKERRVFFEKIRFQSEKNPITGLPTIGN